MEASTNSENTTISNPVIGLDNPFKLSVDYDAEGYFPYFEKHQIQEYLDFYRKNGMVVVRVLDQVQCQQSVDEIWSLINLERPNIDRNNPETWDRFPGMTGMGIFPHIECFSKMACENRQNPNVYDVFKNIIGKENLWVSFDRYGILRPTKNIVVPGKDQTLDKPDWKTLDSWLHWDMNPWVYVERKKNPSFKEKENYLNFQFPIEHNDNYNSPEKVQALIALEDTPIENGGFTCVLGFQNRIQKWSEDNKELTQKYDLRHFVHVPKEDSLFQEAVKVPVRAGCMIVWSGCLPHSNFPNDGPKFRFCQYLKMFPVPEDEDLTTSNEIKKHIKDKLSDIKITELGEKLFRITPWNKKQNCTVS